MRSLKKDNDKKKVENKKSKKVLKTIFIVCGAIILIELIAMLIMYVVNERSINYIDTVNSIKLVDDYYLAAGSSNFRYSKYNKKKVFKYKSSESSKNENIISEQAKIAKYDLNMKLIWEKTFDCDYNATYYDAIKVDGGYIAVGSYVSKYSQLEIKVRDGLIVKYDEDGNVQWFKNYQILGDTEFYRVINNDDGLIVVGQSIYENMEIGNHDTGGGIILKYDYDGNILWNANYGGNKSGSFNDIVVVKDGYIVCGKDGSNYGLLVKYSTKGERLWVRNTLDVAITDSKGFNRMVLYDNKLYIATSVNTSDQKDSEGNAIYSFDASVYVYDLTGKYLTKYKYGESNDECFTDLYVDKTGIMAIGYTLDPVSSKDKYDNQTGIIVKFSFDKEVVSHEYYGGKNYDILSSIILDNENNYLIAGYSNSFENKKDFKVVFKKIEHK